VALRAARGCGVRAWIADDARVIIATRHALVTTNKSRGCRTSPKRWTPAQRSESLAVWDARRLSDRHRRRGVDAWRPFPL